MVGRGIVVDHHQYRQDAVLIGIELAESGLGFGLGIERVGADGDLLVGLMMRHASGGAAAGRALSLSAANAAAILIRRAKRLKTKGIYFLYRVLAGLGLPVLLFYFLLRGLRERGLLAVASAALRFPAAIHLDRPVRAQSGCTRFRWARCWRAWNCCAELRAALPRTPVFVSTSTLAGRAMAGEKLAGLARRRLLRAGGLRLRRAAGSAGAAAVGGGDRGDGDLAEPDPRGEADRRGCDHRQRADFRPRAAAVPCGCGWFFSAALAGVDSILAQSDAMRERFAASRGRAGARAAWAAT